MTKLVMAPWELDLEVVCSKVTVPGSPNFTATQIVQWKRFLTESGAKSSVIESVDGVAKKKTPVFVSGQQIGIGISPLLSLYKILSIQSLAEYLEKVSGNEVRPLFWLQTEDHDLEEVMEVGLFDSTYSLDIFNLQKFNKNLDKLNTLKSRGSRESVGSIQADGYLPSFIDSLLQKFGELEIINRLKLAYAGANLAQGFARFFYSVFPDSNIILFDIREEGLGSLKVNVFAKVLKDSSRIEQILKSQGKALESNGYKTQVKLKEGSPLFFYHPNGPMGPRYRFELENQDFVIPELSVRYSSDELNKMLHSHPECFSSSALLRPLLQDALFNTIAYVGGSAEIAYLRQIEPLYHELSIDMPLRILRPSGLILNDKLAKQFQEISADLFFHQEHDLKLDLIDQLIPENIRPAKVFGRIKKNHLDEISKELLTLNSVDLTLKKPREKTLTAIEEALSKFFEKYEAALIRNEQVLSGRMESLFKQTHPNGRLQERVISSLALGVLYGVDVFDDIKGQFDEWFAKKVTQKNSGL